MITKKEIIRLAQERGACEGGIEWYSKRPKRALLTWEAIMLGYFEWVGRYIPEALPYLKTLPEHIKERALICPCYYAMLSMALIGYRLDVLKDDIHPWVRQIIAERGYALEQLKDDPDELVRGVARDKLTEMQT